MKAIQISRLEGPKAAELIDTDAPVAGEGQVLIDVRAAGVSFPDVLQSRGLYQTQPPMPYIPGAEVAGEVVAADRSTGFKSGDRVAAIRAAGAFAEQVVAQADMVFPLPDSISFEDGASLPLNYLTVYFSLVERGQMAEGESVLIHGAAGGVGTAGIQVAKAFGAGRVIAVTSTAEKGAVALEAGADEFVLAEGFKDAVKADGGVDIVLDPVGGDRFTDSLRCLKDDGRLLVVGFADGQIPTVKVNRLLLNNISVVGVGWGAYAFTRPGHVRKEWDALVPHLKSGALRPVSGTTFPLAEAAEALAFIEDRKATGKVVLTI